MLMPDIFEKMLLGYQLLFEKLTGYFTLSRLAYVVPLMLGVVLLGVLTYTRIKFTVEKLQFKVDKDKRSYLSVISQKLSNGKLTRKLLNNLSAKVSMYTGHSAGRNKEIAAGIIIGTAVTYVTGLMLILGSSVVVWYLGLAYLAVATIFLWLLSYSFGLMSRMRFTSKLPATFKLLNSRYVSCGNIKKAIFISMDDLDKAVKREMQKIYDVLRKNNMKEIDDTFKQIELTYENEYLTLLLTLIKHAHYKGGADVIKQQFEQATEEVLLDIENQKDLTVTSRMYVFMALSLPFGMIAIEKFNNHALGEKALEFYKSSSGVQIIIFFLGSLTLFVGYMLFLERTV